MEEAYADPANHYTFKVDPAPGAQALAERIAEALRNVPELRLSSGHYDRPR